MNIQAYGEDGILVSFEREISESVFRQVQSLHDFIKQAQWKGVRSVTPSYNSVLVRINTNEVSFELIQERLDRFIYKEIKSKQQRKFLIPVCYEPPHSLDIESIAKRYKTTAAEIVKWHCAQELMLYCMGFLPGFMYLGKLEDIEGLRLNIPRKLVPARSVGIAGIQTGIYPMDSPGGWQILGRCPIPIFYPQEVLPFPFVPGDLFQFRSIDSKEYDSLNQQKWTVDEFKNSAQHECS